MNFAFGRGGRARVLRGGLVNTFSTTAHIALHIFCILDHAGPQFNEPDHK